MIHFHDVIDRIDSGRVFDVRNSYLLGSWFISEIAADMIIAAIMCLLLLMRRTGIKSCVIYNFFPVGKYKRIVSLFQDKHTIIKAGTVHYLDWDDYWRGRNYKLHYSEDFSVSNRNDRRDIGILRRM